MFPVIQCFGQWLGGSATRLDAPAIALGQAGHLSGDQSLRLRVNDLLDGPDLPFLLNLIIRGVSILTTLPHP